MDTWVYFPPRIQHKVLLPRPEQPLLGPTVNSLSAVHIHARYLHSHSQACHCFSIKNGSFLFVTPFPTCNIKNNAQHVPFC
jgi:hypothetical protein